MRLLILGPTAVGKTRVSLALARLLNGEIISSDSRQCYKYMNIGTATPSKEERAGIPHFNLSIIDPAQKDSAAKFRKRVRQWEQEITGRGHTLLYVGGSTLHQRCIIQPLDDVPAANPQNVSRLEDEIETEGLEVLYRRLQKHDPTYAEQMDGMNTQRIIRALDVWMQTGKPFSSFHSDAPIAPPEDLLVVGLRRDRQALYDRINRRVEMMFEQGLLDEVKNILQKGYTLADPGLNTVGYKQAVAYLQGKISKEKMMRDIKTKTRRYAKRQMTYFRRWDFVHWLDVDEAMPQETAQKIADLCSRKAK